MARVRIISDGTPVGTQVFDEHGKPITYVTAIKWNIESNGLATAQLTLTQVEVDIVGDDGTTQDGTEY